MDQEEPRPEWVGNVAIGAGDHVAQPIPVTGSPQAFADAITDAMDTSEVAVVTMAAIRQGPDGLTAQVDGQLLADDAERFTASGDGEH